MTDRLHPLALASLLLISACDKWPPYHEELAERFEDNRGAFEALEEKILATHYFRVSGGCVLDSNQRKISNRVVLEWKAFESEGKDYSYDQEYIEDKEWSDLFCQTSVWAVENYDGVVAFGFGVSIDRNNKQTFVEYIHRREMGQSLKPCLPEFEDIPCGLCSVLLDHEWYLEYWWSPEELVSGGVERVLDEEITREEYRELFDRNLEQCRIDGYSRIGYDRDEL